MSFWAYMLHCRGGYFYTGHTDNLEHRVAQHQSAQILGFTAEHQPVHLVWSQEFATRAEALEAERRIKGWSRAKKMALIRGDWEAISQLSKSQKAVRAEPVEAPSSLNSAREGQPFDKLRANGDGARFQLVPHPSSVPKAAEGVSVEIAGIKEGLMLIYSVVGDISALVIPPQAEPVRTDELWRSTCFELFVRGEGLAYQEYNFSPSGEWAAYRFDGYRSGMAPIHLPDLPSIGTEIVSDNLLVVSVMIATDQLEDMHIGLSAIVEERDGQKSYWALAHPEGPPDFHHDACFAASLPPIART